MTAGGTVVMLVGYQGTTATLTIAVNSNVPTLTTTVTGGTGVNLSINPVSSTTKYHFKPSGLHQ